MSTREVPAHLGELFEAIKYAITNRRQLVLMYGGLRREVCPHSLGWKNDRLACFAFQFAGGSRQPLPPNGQWRCLHLHSMSEVSVREGDWHTGPIDPQSSSCIDDFEAYVGFPIGFSDLQEGYSESIVALIAQRVDDAIEPLVQRIEELERQAHRHRTSREPGIGQHVDMEDS